MPTFTVRNGRHQVKIRQQGFKPVTRTFIRKADAVAWGRKVEADMQAGRWVEDIPQVPTLSKAIADYRVTVACHLKGAKSYGYSFKDIEGSALGGKPVDQIEPTDLAAWRDSLSARGLKPATVLRMMGLLSGVLSWCVKEKGYIESNPLSNVRKPSVRDARDRTLSDAEAAYLCRAAVAARAVWLPDVVTVLMQTAMRRSELLGLLVKDCDFDKCFALLRESKNGDARAVPLAPDALAALRRLVDLANKLGNRRVVPVADPEAISTAFQRAVKRGRQRYEEDCIEQGREADPGFLAGLRLHDLRHHAVSAWANTGGLSLVELMAVSGHKSPRMLSRYTHMNAALVAGKLATLSNQQQGA